MTTQHPGSTKPEIDRALEHLARVTRDGLVHGHFEFTITGEIVQGGKRKLIIRAGKSHQFFIAPEELDPQ